MTFADARKLLESEATIENARLNKELSELKDQYIFKTKELDYQIESLTDVCRMLTDRCFILTHGTMCSFCQLNGYHCSHEPSFDERVKTTYELTTKE